MMLLTPVKAFKVTRQRSIPAAAAKAYNLKADGSQLNRLEVICAGEGEAEMYLCGSIGASWFDDSGITEKEARDALAGIPKGTKIKAHINSEGGSVQDGLGIFNAFKERAADVTCIVDGYALSIASVIPLAAGKVISPKSAIWMMHKAWSWAQGNSDDMAKQAAMLEEHDEMLAEIYSAETGKDIKEIRKAMEAETWVRGSQAVEWGLADESDSEPDEDDTANKGQRISAAWLARCKNIPANILNALSGASIPAHKGDEKQQVPATAGQSKEDNSMDKKKIIAQLRAQGVTVSDDATEDQILALFGQIPSKDTTAAIAAIQARLDKEHRDRVERDIDQLIVDQKVTKAEAKFLVQAALTDETVIPTLRQRPSAVNGAGAMFAPQVVSESPFEKVVALDTPDKRYAHMRANWEGLIQDATIRDARGDSYRGPNPYAAKNAMRGGAVAANTYSSTLVTAFLIEGAVTKLQHRWAALKAFARDYSTDRYKPKATGQVKLVTAGSAVLTNATNFEQGNSTVTNAPITVSQYTQPFQVSNDDLNSGLRMEDLAKQNLANFANKIIEVATADITEANFANYSGGSYIAAPAAFGWSDMALLWGALKKADEKNAILDGEYVGALLNTPTFFQQGLTGGNENAQRFGWDGIYLNTDWTGAGTGCRGFICHPQALGAVAGLPLTPGQVGTPIPGNTLSEATAVVPDVGISYAVYNWFSLGSRTMWCSFDMMFGAAKQDTTAGIFVKAS